MPLNLNKFYFRFRQNKHFLYVGCPKSKETFIEEVRDKNLFGIDTEFDWRQTYLPILSTVQISSNKKVFIIDTLKMNNLNFLKDFFQNEKNFFVFHSLRSDSTVLSKCLGIKVKNCFDIQIAEKCLSNNEIKSYARIVKEHTSVNLKKSETRSDWLKRPLTSEQLKYAREDVDFLLDIYKIQKKKLKKRNLLEAVLRLSNNESLLGQEPFKESRLNKIKNKLNMRERDIFLWREELAELENVPPSYIFKDKDLKKICRINSKDKKFKGKIMKIIGDSGLVDNFIKDFL